MIDVIVPYFRDTAGREELMAYTTREWETRFSASHGVQIRVSGDGGTGRPFRRGVARNIAAVSGEGAWLALWDTDVPPPQPQWLDLALRTAQRYGWAPVFSTTVTFTPAGTRRVLDAAAAGDRFEFEPGDAAHMFPMCMGPTVVARRIFRTVGGYDERFAGWGWEDTALRAVLTAMYGRPPPPPEGAICWSLTLDEEDQAAKQEEGAANRELYLREYKGLDRGRALDLIGRLNPVRAVARSAGPATSG